MAPNPDLAGRDLLAEQAHIDRAYERLAFLRATARDLLDTVLRQRGGTPQALAERDVVVRTALQRLQQLELGRQSLCFGRIDREDGESYHIGRLAVSAEDQEPLVVDWRAPVAEPFYRATGRDPMGLVRRRHFLTEGRRVLALEDEIFGPGPAGGLGNGSGPGPLQGRATGPSVLVAALERSRTGRMADIVATVQAEQDEIIRADLAGVLVVQGGPGTGKTAVALHRAAYLLYTHRFPLERQGVLVLGPNRLFLRYIEQVLPALGESGVVLSTLQGLVPGTRAKAGEGRLAETVKGDVRMAAVLARAVKDRQRPLRRPLEVGFEGLVLRLDVDAGRRSVAKARRRGGTHNARRRFLETLVARRMWEEYERALARRDRLGSADPSHSEDREVARRVAGSVDELWGLLRQREEMTTALDRMWPRLSPEELLHDLFGAPPLIRLAAQGRLSEEEQAALHRPRSTDLSAVPWTAADLALLDEARVLLGPRRSRGRSARTADGEEMRTYGHIVVDEAQDLTPMQLRMVGRRSLSGSMTVVGDMAQATGPRAPEGWEDITRHLLHQCPVRVAELTVNYRTPAEIMDLAGRLLPMTDPSLRPPRSVRATDNHPQFLATDRENLAERVAVVAKAQAEAVAPGTVAIVTSPSSVPSVARALEAADVPFGRAEHRGIEERVTLIPVHLVKGLEFDAVVVVDPGRIVTEISQGRRGLYVALTRATQRLTVVHAQPLPDGLKEAPAPH